MNYSSFHKKAFKPTREASMLPSKHGIRLQMAVYLIAVLLCWAMAAVGAEPLIEGDLGKWHAVAIHFSGPKASELDDDPNPFLDYRLRVEFRGASGRKTVVGGYFDGDGKGGASGQVWTVRFTPDEAGPWSFKASLRRGKNVAVDLDPDAGRSAAFDGQGGSFRVRDRDPKAPGFLGLGRLEYAGGHYLKFRDGPYWIKGGADSPEDFLAYAGFDNTRSGSKYGPKTYGQHVRDWRAGDPDWGNGKGKGIVGALNYLASQRVNLIYFLPMNIGGDGKNVWPFAGRVDPSGNESNDNVHYDLGKLRQWEIVFEHAQRKGIVLHFVFNEAERPNKMELGGKELTTERKLFYREMIARFGHHNAVIWNICEEYNIGGLNLEASNVKNFARYIQAQDPYDHPITVHHAGTAADALKSFLGDPLFSITSIQIGKKDIEPVVEAFRKLTREAGRPLPVAVDEFTVTTVGTAWLPVYDVIPLRKEKLWPAYLSGGQVEFILAGLLEVEDFRKSEDLWNYVWFARKFMEENLPFWEMEPADDLLAGETVYEGKTSTNDGQVFAKTGECYAVYFPVASQTGHLDLSAAKGEFEKRWYNPRTGEFEGKPETISGGAKIEIGPPPASPADDWVMLVKRAFGP